MNTFPKLAFAISRLLSNLSSLIVKGKDLSSKIYINKDEESCLGVGPIFDFKSITFPSFKSFQ